MLLFVRNSVTVVILSLLFFRINRCRCFHTPIGMTPDNYSSDATKADKYSPGNDKSNSLFVEEDKHYDLPSSINNTTPNPTSKLKSSKFFRSEITIFDPNNFTNISLSSGGGHVFKEEITRDDSGSSPATLSTDVDKSFKYSEIFLPPIPTMESFIQEENVERDGILILPNPIFVGNGAKSISPTKVEITLISDSGGTIDDKEANLTGTAIVHLSDRDNISKRSGEVNTSRLRMSNSEFKNSSSPPGTTGYIGEGTIKKNYDDSSQNLLRNFPRQNNHAESYADYGHNQGYGYYEDSNHLGKFIDSESLISAVSGFQLYRYLDPNLNAPPPNNDNNNNNNNERVGKEMSSSSYHPPDNFEKNASKSGMGYSGMGYSGMPYPVSSSALSSLLSYVKFYDAQNPDKVNIRSNSIERDFNDESSHPYDDINLISPATNHVNTIANLIKSKTPQVAANRNYTVLTNGSRNLEDRDYADGYEDVINSSATTKKSKEKRNSNPYISLGIPPMSAGIFAKHKLLLESSKNLIIKQQINSQESKEPVEFKMEDKDSSSKPDSQQAGFIERDDNLPPSSSSNSNNSSSWNDTVKYNLLDTMTPMIQNDFLSKKNSSTTITLPHYTIIINASRSNEKPETLKGPKSISIKTLEEQDYIKFEQPGLDRSISAKGDSDARFASTSSPKIVTKYAPNLATPNTSSESINNSSTMSNDHSSSSEHSIQKKISIEEKEAEIVKGRPPQSTKKEGNVCLTPQCVEIAASLLSSMDATLDPCDNFYEYACGKWDREHVIPEGESKINPFTELTHNLNVKIKGILEEPIKVNQDRIAVVRAKTFYESCINESFIESARVEPLLEFLNMLGGWAMLNSKNWNEQSFDPIQTIARLRRYRINVLIQEGLNPDKRNSSIYIVEIDQPKFKFQRERYMNSMEDEVMKSYLAFMVEVAEYLGADRADAEIHMRQTLEFEIHLANISLPTRARHLVSNYYTKMNVGELIKEIPEINWLKYFKHLMPELKEDDLVGVLSLEYMRKLGKLLTVTPKRVVSNFIMWKTVHHLLQYTNRDLVDMEKAFNKLVSTGSLKSRWKICVYNTLKFFPLINGHLFVKRYFDKETKESIYNISKEIKDVFNERLPQIEWMDNQTRIVAQKKADFIIKKIAYPALLSDLDYLDNINRRVNISKETYFGNILKLEQEASQMDHTYFRKYVNRTEWRDTILEVNAYYHWNKNYIMIPAGILQTPFYKNGYPKSVNYGRIGFIIGHETTHAFDSSGSQYNEFGNQKEWWSKEITKNFQEKASCIIDQYGNYTVPEIDIKLNGVATQSENIADNGGIKQAYAVSSYYTISYK
ncbi:unnamed protein product [Gordionus sp. m RMFG-2023]